MIKLATVFSGIGAVEHALERLKIPYEIVFACDNGERRLKTSYEAIAEATAGMSNSEKDKYVSSLYDILRVGTSFLRRFQIFFRT